MTITKTHATTIKQAMLDVVFANQRYQEISVKDMAAKRDAWQYLTDKEKAFDKLIDDLSE